MLACFQLIIFNIFTGIRPNTNIKVQQAARNVILFTIKLGMLRKFRQHSIFRTLSLFVANWLSISLLIQFFNFILYPSYGALFYSGYRLEIFEYSGYGKLKWLSACSTTTKEKTFVIIAPVLS